MEQCWFIKRTIDGYSDWFVRDGSLSYFSGWCSQMAEVFFSRDSAMKEINSLEKWEDNRSATFELVRFSSYDTEVV